MCICSQGPGHCIGTYIRYFPSALHPLDLCWRGLSSDPSELPLLGYLPLHFRAMLALLWMHNVCMRLLLEYYPSLRNHSFRARQALNASRFQTTKFLAEKRRATPTVTCLVWRVTAAVLVVAVAHCPSSTTPTSPHVALTCSPSCHDLRPPEHDHNSRTRRLGYKYTPARTQTPTQCPQLSLHRAAHNHPHLGHDHAYRKAFWRSQISGSMPLVLELHVRYVTSLQGTHVVPVATASSTKRGDHISSIECVLSAVLITYTTIGRQNIRPVPILAFTKRRTATLREEVDVGRLPILFRPIMASNTTLEV